MSNQFDQILKHTLSDYKVSRSEKRVLGSILDEMNVDDQQLAFLRNRAFEIAREEVIGPEADAVLHWLEDIVKILQPNQAASNKEIQSEAYFSPGEECLDAVLRQLKRVRKTADICVFTITDNRIANAIIDAHQRRVKVRIITDNDKAEDRGSDIVRLDSVGIPVMVDNTQHHMHHKFAVFDNSTLLTGSYNWTRSAASYNEENIVITDDQKLVTEFSKEFNKLWKSLAG